jgi:RNA polymerase sigma-70 factor (ECF subfamily)
MSFDDSIILLQPKLRVFAYSLTKDTDMANDLVQDTLYKALRYRDTWSSGTNLKAWLFTIAKNTFINEYRHNKKYQLVDISIHPRTNVSNDCPESWLNEQEIVKMIHQLKPTLRMPFQLHIEGYKYEEISEKLQIKLGTVKSRIFFARKELMYISNQNKKPTTMNDIEKVNIKDRLEAALIGEKLTAVSAAFKLGIKANYISMIKNPKTWGRCPMSAWEIVLKWVNSGQGIVEYSQKHGQVVPAKKEPVPEPVKTVSEITPVVPETVIPTPKIEELAPYPRIKIKPGVLERRQKEIEHKRMSNGELIDALLKEKALLREKIDAIDVLLKHYIS